MGLVIGLFVVVAIVVAFMVIGSKAKASAAEARRAALLAKYKDEKIVERLLAKEIWVGQTSQQLLDSVGQPHDVDQKVLKTKKKEIWKYGHKGGNRYMWRVTLENDQVIGWDEKA
jgi:hypothetical protein